MPRLGLDELHGGVYDQIHREDGRTIKSTKRLWPQVERTKVSELLHIKQYINTELHIKHYK